MKKFFRRGMSVAASVVIVAQVVFVSGGAIGALAEDGFDTAVPAQEETATTPAEQSEPVIAEAPVEEDAAEPAAETPAETVAEAPAEIPAETLAEEILESAVPSPEVETAPAADSVSVPTDEPEAAIPAQDPVLTTDKDDYHPGETATIFGRFFGALEDIVLKIFGSDENEGNYTESFQTVTTGSDGNFSTTYALDDLYRPFYLMEATSADGAVLSQGFFRDSSVGLYDQCSNDDGNGYATGDQGCRWINGNIQSSNSTYFEGDTTPERLWIEGFAPGSSHTLTLKYGTTKAGNHAYDYLTNYGQSESWILVADRCDGITGCATATQTTADMQDDPNVPNTIEPSGASRAFTIRGGTISAVSVPTIVSGTYAGDSETTVTVSFTVRTSGAMCSTKKDQGQDVTSCGVALWFGGHIAKSSEWLTHNGTTGAGAISGSPYHVALDSMDGAAIGSRDNQMSANAIIVQPTLTLVKNVGGGTKVAADFQGKIDGGNVPWSVAQTVAIGSHTASEVTLTDYTPSVWGGDCAANGSVSLTAGQNKTCTITNTYVPPAAKLTVVKTVVNNDGGTLGVSDFPLFVGATSVVSGVQNTFAPGSYTVSETNHPDYAASAWGGDCAANGSITLAAGDVKTCTITNDDIDPIIHVIKHVINDNGGTAVAGDFAITVTNHNPIPSAFSGSETGTDVVLGIGSYEVTEVEAFGYIASYSLGCSGSLGANEEATCTITNDDIAPSLTLVKEVITDNGGTAIASDWTLTAAGYDSESPDAGTYELSESGGPDGYMQTSLTCDNAQGQVTSVTLGLGEAVTCTFVNDDQPGTLIVEKVVINDNGGVATAGEFSFAVDDGEPISFDGTGQNTLVVDAGTYSVTEIASPGYSTTYEDCDDMVIPNGGTATCTITNDDQQAYIIVDKTVMNDNGGSAVADDFLLTVDDVAALDGVAVPVNPGIHTAGETNLSGYTAGTWGGDCDGIGSVTVALGETKTCTITNDDQQAYITVTKVVHNDNGGTASSNSFGLTLEGNGVLSGVTVPVNPGTYTAGEALLAGYAFDGFSGDCDENGDVTIALGQSKTCTITNSDIAPSLTLVKEVITDNGGTAETSDWTLVATGYSAQNPQVGTYDLSESDGPAGYTQTSLTCDNAQGQVTSVTLGLGEHVTCTFVNDDAAPSLTLVKHVINDNGGTASVSDWTLTAEDYDAQLPLVGAYDLSESGGPDGYTQISLTCSNSGDVEVSSVTLGLSESVTCTFVNDDIAPRITVIKHVINDNGGTATAGNFSLFVTGTDANPANFSGDESGTVVTLDAGDYSVGEAEVAGYASSLSADCTGSIAIGETKTCTITNDDQPARLIVIKHVINDDGDEAAASDFTMHLTGTNLSANDFAGSEAGVEVTLNAGAYTVDETNSAGYVKTLSADCSGTIANGQTKTCTITNNDRPHATRTQGFWQTHTTYTSAEFTGSSWIIGSHIVDTPQELFAGFYSSIPKTSTGAKRSALDQARMQMLQQWLAAKLNCKAFGCSLTTQTLLTNAATAFAGTNKALISSYASQLDAYNNSNDALLISGQGKATPAASQTQAASQVSFWNILP